MWLRPRSFCEASSGRLIQRWVAILGRKREGAKVERDRRRGDEREGEMGAETGDAETVRQGTMRCDRVLDAYDGGVILVRRGL